MTRDAQALAGESLDTFSLSHDVLNERISRASSVPPLVADSSSWAGLTPNERGNRARDIAKQERGEAIINKDRGKEILVSRAGLEHWSRFSADPRKAALLDHVRALFERAIYPRSESPDSRKVGGGTLAFHKLALPVQIDGAEMVARLTVREDVNGRWVYDGQLLDTKTPADGLIDVPALTPGGSQTDIQQAREKVLNEAMKVNAALTAPDSFSLALSDRLDALSVALGEQTKTKPEARLALIARAQDRLLAAKADWDRIDPSTKAASTPRPDCPRSGPLTCRQGRLGPH